MAAGIARPSGNPIDGRQRWLPCDLRSLTRPGALKAASISAAASRICRWNLVTPRLCWSKPATTRRSSTRRLDGLDLGEIARARGRFPSGCERGDHGAELPLLALRSARTAGSAGDRARGARRGRDVRGGGAACLDDARRYVRKLAVDAVIAGECEEVLSACGARVHCLESLAGGPHASDMDRLPALHWSSGTLAKHAHHHHRFDAEPQRTGRGDGDYARLPVSLHLLREGQFPQLLSTPASRGHRAGNRRPDCQRRAYVYFIDEIFLPVRDVLERMRDAESGSACRRASTCGAAR